ncbi:MAG: ABC transporter substrate-binding protein [Proteobacteria bacterium]|nr:ABC transporter substrate-binding protein [Pseudomonadota bacterium]
MIRFGKEYFICLYLIFLLSPLLRLTAFAQVKAGKPDADRPSAVIGVDADFTLGGSSAGNAILKGVRLAADEINAGGGVLGMPVLVKPLDHGGVVMRGVENLKLLLAEKNLIGVIGGIHSNVILSELKLIHENKIPYLIPWAAADELVDNGYQPNFVFRLGARDEYVAEFLVSKAIEKSKQIGLLLETTVWGRSNLKALNIALRKRKITPAAVEWIDRADADANIQIAALQKKNAEVVIMVLNAPEGVVALNSMVARGAKFKVLSHWGIAHRNFFESAGTMLKSVEVSFFQPFSFGRVKQEKTDFLLKKVLQSGITDSSAHIDAPSGIAHGYDLTHMLANAFKRAGRPADSASINAS